MADWTSVAPDGTKSVKDNNPILSGNTAYTEIEMNKDHFWNIADDKNGHHKFALMPKYETAASPPLAGASNLAYFAKEIAGFDVQPFASNAGGIMQLLGIRACGVFTTTAGVINTQYSHNCTIAWAGVGRYTVNFTTALPTANYLFLGGAVSKSTASNTNDIIASLVTLKSTSKTTGNLLIGCIVTLEGNSISPPHLNLKVKPIESFASFNTA